MSSKTKQILSLAKLEIQTQEDPLQLFYNDIKSQETNAYKKTLQEFLDSIEDFEDTFEDKAKHCYFCKLRTREIKTKNMLYI